MAQNLKAYRQRHHVFDKVQNEFMAAGHASAVLSDEVLKELDAIFGTVSRDEATASSVARPEGASTAAKIDGVIAG